MSGPVAAAYQRLLAAGELKADPDQARAAAALDRLGEELALRRGFFARLLGRRRDVCGVYLWGGVGRGKSMLMDLAFEHIAVEPKRRVHFHAFMIEVHERLRAERAKGEGDPIPAVAEAIAEGATLLCFDEMVVNNPADAMILSRLFSALLEEGVAVVTTSNRAPAELYKDGLNRELFLPFIDLIGERLEVIALNGPTDYRLDRMQGVETWHVPNGPAATAALSRAFFQLTDYPPEDRAHVPTEELEVGGGRTLHVPKSLKGVAVFSFKRLCGEARGAADYLAIARRFHTVIIVGIPVMGPDKRNEAARFVTLIDELYEHRVKLLAAADAEPERLYPAGTGAFEFQRTVSRLEEMRSADYLASGHGRD
ncbi:cell division protein ZapE [Sphingomonas astaxanthinifaciens]|uniref:Cell division protein ZapE n=1 Tax=Sphingomonas astaxanthinifaciens DSM 22298 TaxID=1123267 RepID=A0ABQ5Z3Y2_9SPHN|nr:cell division protein ZapE [Sphingomonas astaxanthinifaciens]GLR47504.1 cell division protein ZapE [Sphingomonas astaxanthinifaciens DSM 22298]